MRIPAKLLLTLPAVLAGCVLPLTRRPQAAEASAGLAARGGSAATADAGDLRAAPGSDSAAAKPDARGLFGRRRFGLAVQPATGLLISSAVGSMESALRGRSMSTIDGFPGYARSGVTEPFLGAAWLRLTARFSLEAVANLSTASFRTAAGDSATGTALGLRLDNTWTAVLASASWGDLHVGLGPAFVHETWHVATDSLRVDSTGMYVWPLSSATSARNIVGLFAQARLTEPISAHFFAEFRAWLLLQPSSTTPAGLRAPSLVVHPRHSGFGIFFGAAL